MFHVHRRYRVVFVVLFILCCTKVLSDKTRQKVNLFSVWFIGMDCGNFKGMFELEYIENRKEIFDLKITLGKDMNITC